MWFWIKHLSLAFILILAAVYFLMGDGPLFKQSPTFNNSAAKGLSQFYESIKKNEMVDDKRAEFVLNVKVPEQSIEQALKSTPNLSTEVAENWQGASKSRRFEPGTTLKSAMEQYAKEEGITFLWYLDKDYVVKHNFRVNDNFVSTLYQVGQAINSDFEFDVKAYFCPSQKTAVITDKPTPFVRDNCVEAQKTQS